MPYIRTVVAPLRGRGLKRRELSPVLGEYSRSLTGAWIETPHAHANRGTPCVAPLRGRGLKPKLLVMDKGSAKSLPYGGVD